VQVKLHRELPVRHALWSLKKHIKSTERALSPLNLKMMREESVLREHLDEPQEQALGI
jgi:hypothetical protein